MQQLSADDQTVYAFLQAHHMAVVATNTPSGNSPESALLAYVEADDFVLYFQTNEASRKARNLQHDPYVSLVIGLELAEMATLQYEGRAELITDPAEVAACKRRFDAKGSPSTAKYYELPGAQFYRVIPRWLRLYRSSNPDNIERHFGATD